MPYDVLVIGGGPAGLSAAVNVRIRGRSVLVVSNPPEENPLWRAERVDNYLSLPGHSGPELLTQMRRHAESAGVEFLTGKVLTSVRSGKLWYVSVGTEMYAASALVLAAGVARGKKFPGEAELLGRGVSYCATCDGAFFRGKDVAIVGGGNTALEDALYLANVCRTVYLVHRRDAFRGEKALADRVRQKENIKIQYDSAVSKIRGESAVSSVLLENTKTGAQQELPVSAVFVAIGLIPENEIFSRQLPLDDNGYFVAGEDCKTPLEGVFVAGDCRSKLLRQIITAAADGAVAGYQAAAYVNGI